MDRPACRCCGVPARETTLPEPVYVPYGGMESLTDAPVGWITKSWEWACDCGSDWNEEYEE